MTVLAALAAYYDRMAARGEASEPGYAPAKVSFEIVLRPDGVPCEVNDLRVQAGKHATPRLIEAPIAVKRASNIEPNFLWEKTAYLFGVIASEGDPPRAIQGPRTQREHEKFKSVHIEQLGNTDDEGLRAIVAFLQRWRPDEWEARGWPNDALDTNFVFRLHGDRAPDGQRRFIHQRPAARAAWTKYSAPKATSARCLVSGEIEPTTRLHPVIRGVAGAPSQGASLISFNLDSFKSFGKDQGSNSPIGERAAFAYGTALNALLAKRKLLVGDATVVFWADATETSEKEASAAEGIFAAWLNPEGDDPDLCDFVRMRSAMESISEGRGWASTPELNPKTRLHVLGLAANEARLVVRFWHVGSFGEFAGRLAAHYRDLDIEPAPFARPPKFGAWLFETALKREAKNIPPLLGGEFMGAILTGARYPRTLLSAVVRRIRADGGVNGARAALCKAVINRDVRLTGKGEEIPVALDRDNNDAAYRLGRLFALLERAQTLALPGLNATIRDRYFAGASATPQRIFPTLLRNAQNHIAAVRKGDKAGLAPWLDKEIGEIWAGLEPDLPRALRLEDQGRFFAGYYHQRFARTDRAGVENLVADSSLEQKDTKEV